MSESEAALPQDFASGKAFINQWTDICFGVLVAPIRTFQELSEHDSFPVTNDRLCGALLTVLLANIVCAMATSAGCAEDATGAIFASIFAGLFNWFGLASVLSLLSGWLAKSVVPYRTALLSVGWTFLPMIFAGPLSCLRLLGPVHSLIATIPTIWMLYLLWVAADRCMDLGTRKMFALYNFRTADFSIRIFVLGVRSRNCAGEHRLSGSRAEICNRHCRTNLHRQNRFEH